MRHRPSPSAPRPARARPAVRVACAGLVAAMLAGPPGGLAAQTPAAGEPTPLRLPALGESASDEFNLSQEKRIGDDVMRQIRQDPDYLDDPVLLAYIDRLWQPLVQAAKARGDIGPDTAALFPYEVFLVRDRSVNAFALPGGYVGVHLALIAMTATPDELASVLAHELSHVTQRHIARAVTGQSRQGALGLAAMLLGLIVASRSGNPDVAQAAIMGTQGALVQGQLNFSRDMEREADRNGFALMVQAGFAPVGMASMFDKLDQSSRLNDSGAFPYLRSHPLSTDRMGDARQRVEAMGAAGRAPGAADPPPLVHALMQMRARVLMDPSVQAQRRLQDLDENGRRGDAPWGDRLVAHYGSMLASAQLRDFMRAGRSAEALQALLREGPASAADEAPRRVVGMGLAQFALQRGDPAAAQALLQALPGREDRPSLMLRAQVALVDGRAEPVRDAADRIQTWLADHRHDASAWMMQAQLAERMGQTLRSIRAQAEAQAVLGNLQGAIDRLQAGQRAARQGGPGIDFIEASVIDARLRDLMAQRRLLLAEREGRRRPGEDPGERGDAAP